VREGDVIRPMFGTGLPVTLLRLLGETLEVPGLRLARGPRRRPTSGRRVLEDGRHRVARRWLITHQRRTVNRFVAVCGREF